MRKVNTYIGAAVERVEDLRFLRGRGEYIGDVTRPETIDTMLELERGFATQYPGRHVAFVVNKSDLLPEAQRAAIPDRLKTTGLSVIVTSAKTGDNVEHAFRTAANAIIRRDV